MTEGGDEKSGSHYFDVEKFRRIHEETSKKRGRWGRFVNRIFWGLHSVETIATSVLFPLVMIPGMLLGIVLILYYGGGIAFYGTVGAFFVLVGVFGEKKLSASRFSDENFAKKILLQVVAYSIVVGIFLTLFFVFK